MSVKMKLLENGINSFAKGIDNFCEYDIFCAPFAKEVPVEEQEDIKQFLKNAISDIHHGIELLLKYLIYTKRKQWPDKGDKKRGMISFNEIVQIAKDDLKIDGLTDELAELLRQLNHYRNQVIQGSFEIEHSAATRLGYILCAMYEIFSREIENLVALN